MFRFLVTFVALYSFSGVLVDSFDMEAHLNRLHSTCVAETGVSEDVIAAAQKGNFIEDEKLKCYMKCHMAVLGAVSDDGIINMEALLANFPPEIQSFTEPLFRGCGTKIGANPCDNIFQTNKCWYEMSPKDYVLA